MARYRPAIFALIAFVHCRALFHFVPLVAREGIIPHTEHPCNARTQLMKDTTRINFSLPDDVIVFAKKSAKGEYRSLSNWIAMLIRQEMAAEKRGIVVKKHEIN